MPHQPRDTSAGVFHVFTHCVWAAPGHFRDDLDRLEFLRELARATAKTKWKCIAFCLMTTHYHLIVNVEEGVLPKAMHAVNLGYARGFNKRHALRGHVQFRRYGSRRIHDDSDLLNTFKYLAKNPVEAGLCKRPAEWPWSTYAGTLGLSEPHSFVDVAPLLRCFTWPDVDPIAALRAHVEEP